MSLTRRLSLSLKALRQLGPRQLGWYTWYRLGLRSGYLRRITPENSIHQLGDADWRPAAPPLRLPNPAEIERLLGKRAASLFGEASEILAGQVRLFGGAPVPLQLTSPGQPLHWTEIALEAENGAGEDIKFTWEPGRFGWVFSLGRAYHLSRDERYAEAFWRHSEIFLGANPPNTGAQWVSAQEVALRLVALVFGAQVFATSPYSTDPRLRRLDAAIASHAARIPPTLAYARAQNNNHLLSEAAGLLTAGEFLPGHPAARRWRELGWKWLNRGLCTQIGVDGSYTQHSTNYHRLVLQIALWVTVLGREFPAETQARLAAATRWLSRLVDPLSGRAPNLGPNDGAFFLPLSSCPFDDYRPVIQAASLAFLGAAAFPAGAWDELALWLGIVPKTTSALPNEEAQAPAGGLQQPAPQIIEDSENELPERSLTISREAEDSQAPAVLRLETSSAWAYLRAARFHDRPGHADQLHLDLWWRGLNVAQDAGTYLYNARTPWNNPLSGTAFHNTLTVNGQNQMLRAGKFLWLDWAQASGCSPEVDQNQGSLCAEHDGYRRLGVIHRRTVTTEAGTSWVVQDELLPAGEGQPVRDVSEHLLPGPGKAGSAPWTARLHWLLPDWLWRVEEDSQDSEDFRLCLKMKSPAGWMRLAVSCPKQDGAGAWSASLCRAGELFIGEGQAEPTRGWFSPTYGYKFPALSLAIEVGADRLPLVLRSNFIFPGV
jgi:hypothetical protein